MLLVLLAPALAAIVRFVPIPFFPDGLCLLGYGKLADLHAGGGGRALFFLKPCVESRAEPVRL